MEPFIIAALVVVAVAVLVGTVVSGRRGHDPSTSVRDFTRALSALERTDAPRPGGGRSRSAGGDNDDEQLQAG